MPNKVYGGYYLGLLVCGISLWFNSDNFGFIIPLSPFFAA